MSVPDDLDLAALAVREELDGEHAIPTETIAPNLPATAEQLADEGGAVAIGEQKEGTIDDRNSERHQRNFTRRVGFGLDHKTLKVREAMAQALEDNMTPLLGLLQNGTPMVKVRVFELLARHALGEPGTITADAVRLRVLKTVQIIQESTDLLTDKEADELVERIRSTWSDKK